ncbi:NTP transferase domain-containing protein [Olsenella sp. YH-ols2217]|uniref:NTP transferase domain-containing protein n=1 Tax=Kribbibacterium absianum TaxID=3044210 RepID=A0ABT6ZHU8_9ACTN|nr:MULTISPECIES: NTP transferase domain-containing protein [unclassified Olsenella]MDJ1121135.1 NTP transferase domain-containing protein [Olsenella sp. YH-ols2216]MDJ1128626.1 NTP transferase domain-containing protein [Olsenella sp. YH-ols2217]
MTDKRVAACIAAGESLWANPLVPVGDVSAVRRAVIAFQQAGAFPLVVVTDRDDKDLKAHLANRGIVFLRHDEPGPHELFDSVKLGFSFLAPMCDYVAFAPVNTPVFSVDTVRRLVEACEQTAQPSYQGHSGHPVVVSSEAVPEVLAYQGPAGLRGAIRSLSGRRWVDVDEESVTATVFDDDVIERALPANDAQLVRPVIRMTLERDEAFCDERTKLLLFLVEQTGNLRRSCDLMALSYAKGWSLVNELEDAVGFAVVNRRRGGAQGGATQLTDQGARFLHAYLRLERGVLEHAQRRFDEELAGILRG